MPRIEEYWDDIMVYYVEFSVYDKKEQMFICRKTLVLPAFIHEEEVKEIIKTHFTNVSEVLAVDTLNEGLLLKDRFL